MVKNPNRFNRVEIGNPQRGNVEIINAYYDPTRGISQEIWGLSIKDGQLKAFKLDSERGGWLDMGNVGSGSEVFHWDAAENGEADNGYVNYNNDWSTPDDVACDLIQYLRNDGTNNCETAVGSFYLASAGNYTFHGLFWTDTDGGKMDIEIDDTVKGTLDFYTAARNRNNTMSVDLGELSAGLHSIKLKGNGKNGSSSAYYIRIQIISIRPT